MHKKTLIKFGIAALCLCVFFIAYLFGGRPASPNQPVQLDLSSEYVQGNTALFLEEYSKPANFEGHFRIVNISCGDSCLILYALDKNTGKVYRVTSADSNGGAGVEGYAINGDRINVWWMSGYASYISYDESQDAFVYAPASGTEGI